MKYTIMMLILTTLLWFQNCKNEEIDPHVSGEVIAGAINGKHWQNTNLRIGYSKKCTQSIGLNIVVFNEDRFLRESFGIGKIPLREGSLDIIKYEFTGESVKSNCLNDSTTNTNTVSASYYTLQDDGHVIKDTYMVFSNPKEKNRLTITKLDLTNNHIEAEFDATFILKLGDDGKKWFADSPDTLRFKGVKFKASIVNLQ